MNELFLKIKRQLQVKQNQQRKCRPIRGQLFSHDY